MKYNSSSNIQNMEDVITFFHHLVYELNLNFHPDDDFKDYVLYNSNLPMFSNHEIIVYNRLMNQCFEICQASDQDIYEIGCEQLLKRFAAA